ncbi:hypothetical protein AVEN_18136-1 [Araneus ventricosus]|uniref:Uncharacterized protein n=1 Tax=Araneus ventricosus TaxID=182803 RepID=A0A4Y2AI83_ARAVE|nr:hypothetical protein AVEN_18136-1 [Araneus ventricosus]
MTNLWQTCTLVMTNLWQACCKLKLLSGKRPRYEYQTPSFGREEAINVPRSKGETLPTQPGAYSTETQHYGQYLDGGRACRPALVVNVFDSGTSCLSESPGVSGTSSLLVMRLSQSSSKGHSLRIGLITIPDLVLIFALLTIPSLLA